MEEKYVTRSAETPALGEREDCDDVLLEAPFDGLIANVAFTPSQDIQGAYYTRSLQLHARSQASSHIVTHLSLDSDDLLLPSDERQSLPMLFPPVSLRVREGDSLVWSSIGSVGEGLAVPTGSVEILFERREISEYASLPGLWRSCVPSYWINKSVQVIHHDRDIVGPRSNFSSTFFETTGYLLGADTSGIRLQIRSDENDESAKETLLFFNRVEKLKLITDA